MTLPVRPAPLGDAAVFSALPLPVIVIGAAGRITAANAAAEEFFGAGAANLLKQSIEDISPFASPILGLIAQVRRDGGPVSEYGIDLGLPRAGVGRRVDVQAAPLADGAGSVVLVLQERSIAQKMDRQLISRGAARSVTAMATVLAHEIKNPLAGIRGAAQLIEQHASPADRELTQLICAEADRIVGLVERMESFGDSRPLARRPVNIHDVLDHVRKVAQAGVARGLRFSESYDPSLPPVPGDRDQLIQVFLNLVKNAVDAIADGPEPERGEIALATAYRPGVRLTLPGSRTRVSLPLEVSVRDNGCGVPPDLLPVMFDPFVTTKRSGAGLGLALVAKIIGDHGGIVDCESAPRRTRVRVLLPVESGSA